MTSKDDGIPDRRLAAALAGHNGSAAAGSELLAALAGARVFLALATRPLGSTPAVAEKSGTQLALMSIQGNSGTRALPAFAAARDVQRWQPQARPVPVPGPLACSTALQDHADALLLDPLGAALAISGPTLRELAAGRLPVVGAALSTHHGDVVEGANVEPDLLAALGRALRDEPVQAARVLSGPAGVVLAVTAHLGPAAAAALAARVRDRLGADLPAAGLDLTVREYEGPGQPVPIGGVEPAAVPRPRPWRLGGRRLGGGRLGGG